MTSVAGAAARQLVALTFVGAAVAVTAGMLLGGTPRSERAMLSASGDGEARDAAAAASDASHGHGAPPPLSDSPAEPVVVLPRDETAGDGASGHCSGGRHRPGTTVRSTRWPGWASTSGTTDVHAFADEPHGSRYVLFFDVQWDQSGRAVLRRTRAQEWRQTLSVDLPADAQLFRIDQWATDLPGACLAAQVTGRRLRISVSVRKPLKVQAGRRYGTEMLATAPESVTGQRWSYEEELVGRSRGLPADDLTRWGSPPRSGAVGTCSICYAAWGVR